MRGGPLFSWSTADDSFLRYITSTRVELGTRVAEVHNLHESSYSVRGGPLFSWSTADDSFLRYITSTRVVIV